MRKTLTSTLTGLLVLVALLVGSFACAAAPGAQAHAAALKHRFLEAIDEMEADEQAQARLREQARVRAWERLQSRVRERLQAAQALADEGKIDEAITSAEECEEENPGIPEVADMVQELKQLKEKKIEHERVKALLRLALTERENALQQLREFLTEHPTSWEAFKAISRIEEEQGRFKEATEAMEEAFETDHENTTIRAEMKRLYMSSGDKSLKVFVKGKKPVFDQPPVIVSGRTLVPIRAIGQALGATVEWNEETREVVISKGDIQVTLQLENKVALVNGETIELDVPPKSMNGRTVIPLRFVAEALKCNVDYDGDSGMITVDDEEKQEEEQEQQQEQQQNPQ